MAHFVELDNNNVVIRGIVVHNNELLIDGVESEQKGKDFCSNLFGGEWVQTSYNNSIRKQYAGIGFTYDADADEFVAPQPFPSWSLDTNNDWQAPAPMPSDGKRYYWDEETTTWIEVTE